MALAASHEVPGKRLKPKNRREAVLSFLLRRFAALW